MSYSAEYATYHGMVQRVTYPKHKDFHNYGARGITICERWMGTEGFQNFFADMGLKPSGKHSLEREDNEKGYSPENCRWATGHEQGRNKRTNRHVTWQGRTQCLVDWSVELGGGRHGISSRLNRGWTLDRAMSTPFASRN